MGGMANSAEEPVVDVHRESEVAPENDLEEHEEEDEYVILDLEEVFHGAALPANCAYTLSGLDTMNPVLTLGDDLKLIGEYEETMGTVLVFTERDEEVPEDERIRGSNLKETGTRKRVSSLCQTQRKLKFRLMERKESKDLSVQEKRSRV
ncbi:general transcription factor 3C polypeptide 6 [Marchantia polymorpha subsp. ruderalis]|uniref:Transcription factor TFIIIC triple barrel domain-containing protein n=2 Tax=Marchantia polymorpha TaxID=3197 RepID=A0AAF6BX79_MARPO|nr:hypothetical protein MARPO_0076s0011 [Marchantia polymorpha]BBN16613.1 hypothetical protein Mp_7g07830 [Marchantia polymorpha subsp. ruderalis]|eukprot:PTQ34764.1 hypothetical protein MARPO_0076s0011 [Marchantia polymorpha]